MIVRQIQENCLMKLSFVRNLRTKLQILGLLKEEQRERFQYFLTIQQRGQGGNSTMSNKGQQCEKIENSITRTRRKV